MKVRIGARVKIVGNAGNNPTYNASIGHTGRVRRIYEGSKFGIAVETDKPWRNKETNIMCCAEELVADSLFTVEEA
jgi:hypothetical protein